ncbi:hypothetical protein LEP1GSC179_2282 [Leptospira santarosai str. MOR084]|uniref:Uncharacterized protein n=1 Tax=Leptospira santarosai str. MOR084 TaxID=1049984 RepID=A0A0E2BIC4_9LEPT|nr:hypothetical protein LEP1GSC179_2282 [Leptospira santarosai str. MOR084]
MFLTKVPDATKLLQSLLFESIQSKKSRPRKCKRFQLFKNSE